MNTLEYLGKDMVFHRVVAGVGYPDSASMVERSRPKFDEHAITLFEHELEQILGESPTIRDLAGRLRHCLNVTTHEETREELAIRLGRFVAAVAKNADITDTGSLVLIATFSAISLNTKEEIETTGRTGSCVDRFFAGFTKEANITHTDLLMVEI